MLALNYSKIIDYIFNLNLNDKIELKNMIEQNIIEDRRNEIYTNYKETMKEYNEGKMKFSSNVDDLMKTL